jgi:WD40 repeat protein
LVIGQILKSGTLVAAVICLAGWWEQGSTESPDNVLVALPDMIISVASSPDGRRLASGNYHGSIIHYDLLGRKSCRLPEGKGGPVWDLAWSPDGSMLAAAYPDGSFTLCDTRSWNVRRELQADPRSVRCLSFSPDGTLLATGGSASTITLWDTATWRSQGISTATSIR